MSFAQFSAQAGRRVWKQTLAAEKQSAEFGDDSPLESLSFRLAYTTGGATARVGTAVGTGTAVLCYIDDTGNIVQETTEIDIINITATPVGTTRYINVIQLGTRWQVILEECS